MLIVGEHVVQGGVLLLAAGLPPHQAPGLLGDNNMMVSDEEIGDNCDSDTRNICHF